MSSAAVPSKDKVSTGKWLSQHRVLVGFLVGIVLLAIAVGYFSATAVSGIEMNPIDWKVRRFWFRRDPFTNTRFTGIYYSPVTQSGIWSADPTKQFAVVDPALRADLKTAGSPAEWDLVKISDGAESIGPAVVWFELLQTYTSGYDLHWVKWTGQNPKLAKVLWPAVQDMTRFGLYAKIPALLELTRQGLDVDEFEQQVNEFALRSLLEFCASAESNVPGPSASGPSASGGSKKNDSSENTSARIEQSKITSAAAAAAEYGDHPDLQRYLR